MSKEIQKKETAEIAEYNELIGDLPSADASDYRIPNLCIVQPTSKLIATPGEVLDLNTKAVVSAVGTSFTFVPIWFYKSWDIFFEDKNKNREYRGKELFSPKNAMWRWTEEVEGGTIQRHLNTNVFLILEKDLTSAMPQLYMFKFKGKSSNEGKKLLTFWTNAKNYKQAPFSYLFSITPTMVTDQKGKYFVATLANVVEGDQYKRIDGEALKVAAGWVRMVQTNLAAMTSAQLSPDEDEVEDSAPIPSGPLAPPSNMDATVAGRQLQF